MILIIQNNLNEQRSYLGGAAVVAANESLTVPAVQIFMIARDPLLMSDCDRANVSLSDSITTYRGYDAISYLNLIATSLGGQVVGYVGAAAPPFSFLVSGKTGAGVIQPALLDSSRGMIIAGEGTFGTPVGGVVSVQHQDNSFINLTGNATTTVKSGSGKLQSIVINDNNTGGTVGIYDNTAGSGTLIGTIAIAPVLSGQGPTSLFYGLKFSTGLTLVTSGSSNNDITVVYT